VPDIGQHCKLDGVGERLLEQAMQHFGVSAWAYDHIRKVVWTIADLDGAETLMATPLSEVMQYRAVELPP
jgi:magnesium chelatase family protein